MHLVGSRDQPTCMNTISFSLVHDILTRGFKLANFFFSLFSLCMSSSQPISFFFPTIFSHTSYICTTQPVFESSLDNAFSWFFYLFLVLGMTLNIFKMTTKDLSARTYDCSTIILILLKAVNTAGYTVTLILSCMGSVYEGAGQPWIEQDFPFKELFNWVTTCLVCWSHGLSCILQC